jgi:hypothetical protein
MCPRRLEITPRRGAQAARLRLDLRPLRRLNTAKVVAGRLLHLFRRNIALHRGRKCPLVFRRLIGQRDPPARLTLQLTLER